MQTSLRSRGRRLAAPVPSNVVASINTHDMFPFAGFLRGDDIAARLETRQIDRLRADSEMAARKRLVTRLAELEPLNRVPCVSSSTKGSGLDWASEQAGVLGTHDLRAEKLFLRALEYLMNSAAAIVLVNLEDLLLETYPQNMPGTGAERGNWRRRAGGSEADVRRALMNNIACFRLRST